MNAPAATLPSPPQTILWGRSIAWLLFLGPFFFLSYGTANHLAASAGVSTSLFFEWERAIPFLAWTIVPYWSIDLLYGFSFLCCRGRQAVDRHALRLLTAQLVSVACFLLFPLRFAFERPPADGLAGAMFTALSSFDQPYNQAPSLHIGLLVLVWFQFTRLPTHPAIKALIHTWALLIGVSVLTTWQHHFIDLPTGAAVGLLCLWLWPEHGSSPLANRLTGSPHRRTLAARYLLGALALAAVALLGGGAFLWLFWPALSLFLVALNYAIAGAAGFQKQDGQHRLAIRLLLAPYLAGAWINSRWWTRHHPQPDLIADGVWLGRIPTAAEFRHGGFAALLDLAAELPTPTGLPHGGHLPWLDLVPPTADELRVAARQIEQLRAHGPLLVACALGYSRSAAAVAAWLHLSGRAVDMAEAIDIVRQQRPQIVLGADWLAVFSEFEAQWRQEGYA